MEKTEKRMLMCQLTDDEQRMRGVELAAVHERLAELDGEKKALADSIKREEGKRDQLATVVKYKQEEREVVCTLHPNYAADSMTIRRTDTGDIVCIRQLQYGEKAPMLPMDGIDEVSATVTCGPSCVCGHSQAEHVNGADECLGDGCDCKGFLAKKGEGDPLFEAARVPKEDLPPVDEKIEKLKRNVTKLLEAGITPIKLWGEDKEVIVHTGPGPFNSEREVFKSKASAMRDFKARLAEGAVDLYSIAHCAPTVFKAEIARIIRYNEPYSDGDFYLIRQMTADKSWHNAFKTRDRETWMAELSKYQADEFTLED